MEFILTAAVMVFAVYGAAEMVKRAYERFLCPSFTEDRILIYVKSREERIETVVRGLMVNNPTAEIIVVDEGKNENMREILDKLCSECGRIHIKRRAK